MAQRRETSRIVSCWKSASVPAIAGLKRDNRIKALRPGQSPSSTHSISKKSLRNPNGSLTRGPITETVSFGSCVLRPRSDDAEVEDAVVRVWVVPDAPPFRQNLVELDFKVPRRSRAPRDYETRRRGSLGAIDDNDSRSSFQRVRSTGKQKKGDGKNREWARLSHCFIRSRPFQSPPKS